MKRGVFEMEKRFWIEFVALCCLTVALGFAAHGQALAAEEITVYTALETERIDKYIVSFYEQHPDVQVNFVRDSTGIITAKLLAEGENTPADLVWGTAVSSLLVLDQQGMIEPYAPAGLERIEPMLRDSAETPKWVGLDAWELAIVVNTVEAENLGLPEVTSYQDLLNPALKGQIVMSNPASSGTGFLAVSGMIQLMGEDKTYAYLDQLHENIAMYTHSGSAPAKKAAAGEFAVGISYGYAGMNQIKKGMPVKVIFPTEGSGWDVEGNALIKKTEMKDAAKTFLDWAISDAAVSQMADDYAILSVTGMEGATEGYAKNPLEQLIQNNDLNWAASNRDAILKEWTARYDGKSEAK